MALKKINFTYEGVKYKDIDAIEMVNGSYSVYVVGTSKMIRQFLDQKYPQFTGRGSLWVKSRKFANGNSIDVYFNRIPDEYISNIKKDLDMFEYYDGHNYKSKKINTEEGLLVDAGTKYLSVTNFPPYGAKERDEPEPDWDAILSKTAKPSGASSAPTRSFSRKRASYEWGDRIAECNGWELYKKPYNDTVVYNLVKKQDTPPNKTSWNEIRGLITTQEGFKWTPKTQTFAKWGEIKDIKSATDNLCRILGQYYNAPSAPADEPTPQPNEPTSAQQPSPSITKDSFEPNDRFNFLSSGVDVNLVWVVDKIENDIIYTYREGKERSSSFNWTESERGKELIELGKIRFLEPLSTSAPISDTESIEKKIKGLELVLKYAKTDTDKKVAENKINALKIILKYKK